MVPLRRLLAAKLPLADKDMLAARTSRHPSGGRPHFSAAVIECGRAGTRCAHSTPGAEKNRAPAAAARRNRPHSWGAPIGHAAAARTSRHLPGGRPHFSPPLIKCGPERIRCAHSTPYAEKNLALGAATRQIRPHSMSALVSARRQRGLHAHEKGPDPWARPLEGALCA